MKPHKEREREKKSCEICVRTTSLVCFIFADIEITELKKNTRPTVNTHTHTPEEDEPKMRNQHKKKNNQTKSTERYVLQGIEVALAIRKNPPKADEKKKRERERERDGQTERQREKKRHHHRKEHTLTHTHTHTHLASPQMNE